MKLFNRLKSAPFPTNAVSGTNAIIEKLKGTVTRSEAMRLPSEIGEEHPFDYDFIEKFCRKFGVLNAIVNKHVDFMLSAGINIASEDERAKEIIEQWMQDVDFRTAVRPWLKEGIKKGFGAMELGISGDSITELQVLNSNRLYKVRDATGKVEQYNLIKNNAGFKYGGYDKFNTNQIAEINFGLERDMPYGVGMIYPLISIINQLLGSRSEMHRLMYRKANSPLIFRGGDTSQKLFPSTSDTNAMKEKLVNLKNNHEWAISALWKPETIDFGNIGDKFNFIIENDIELLYMAAEIPAFLMGKASIPEGLAKEQMKAFMYKITSLREDAEKVIEQQFFKRVLNAQGIDAHVEVVWGLPSEEEKNERVKLMNEVIKNPFTSPSLKKQLEEQIMVNFDLDAERLETDEEERRREEEEEQQPRVPGQNRSKPSQNPPANDREEVCGCGQVHEVDTSPGNCGLGYSKEEMEAVRNLTLKEWVGFNYSEYVEYIVDYLKQYNFEFLRGYTKTQLRAGLLNAGEIDKLRTSLIEVMQRNESMGELEKLIKQRINLKDRYKMKNGRIVVDKKGNPIVTATASKRANMIARTETVRSANEGALRHFKDGGIEKVRHVAALSDRTCPTCSSLNGTVYNRKEALVPPIHPSCRCTLTPVVE